ncbi:MAG: hypothetical protein HY080_06140 [Gammaproteobacteria bacterium]|nr:hypothetical protein [Gammaproteobacteria bacterium]
MLRTISKVLAFSNRKSETDKSLTQVAGFTYAAPNTNDPMQNAKCGEIVRIKGRKPPWLIVNHEITSIAIPSQWPGRLWRTEIVDVVTDSDVVAARSVKPTASAGYTRAVAIRVIEELPLALLFGPQGEAICAVISRAGNLELDDIPSLAKARCPEASEVYSRVWRKWLGGNDELPNNADEDLSGTLLFPGTRGGSPINRGFSVIYTQVAKRAEELVGSSAFVVDPIDSEGACLEPTWAAACNALLDAAMAFGAPTLLSGSDASILATAWHKVIGQTPTTSRA